ncbi:unnamed protein product [Echinostoma caproni]|uniref:UBR-type domain-containing protein n=1 Tax=Echinostoma caproni TaxID=27848 RepID=A0A183AL86_9TREM|nr:unnamed protein product [Echinostoma caproni]
MHALSFDSNKPHPLFCGRPVQLILFRLAASIALQIMEEINGFSQILEYEPGEKSNRCSRDVSTSLFRLLDTVLTTLHRSLLVRANFLRHFATATTHVKSACEEDDQIGCCFAQLIETLDAVEAQSQTSSTPINLRRLNTPLSKLIYLLSSEPSLSCSSETGVISNYALRHLGYYLTSSDSLPSSSPERWILCPGPRVFCLLGNHVISQVHCLQGTDAAERFIKSIWSWFLSSLQFNVCDVSDSPLALVDVNSNLLQLICLLAGQIPGLTAKKYLLYQLISCFNQIASRMVTSTNSAPMGRYYHLCTRLVVLLRYMLHHFYVPPTHLSEQLKSGLTLDQSGNQAIHIWTYDIIQTRQSKILDQIRPHLLGSSALPLFYDLLTPASGHDKNSTESAARGKWNLPSPDGLILPPSLDLGIELHALLGKLTRPEQELSVEFPKIVRSPSRLIYLAILLDRIQGKPTSVEPQLISDLAGNNASKIQHYLTLNPSQEQTATRKATQTVHQLTIEIYRAVCARYGISEKSAKKADTLELPSEMLSCPFAHLKDVRSFLLALKHPVASVAMFYDLAASHIHELRPTVDSDEPVWDQMSQGQLVYLSGLVHFIAEILPCVLSSEKPTVKPVLSTISSDSSAKRKPKQRTRHATGKTSTLSEGTDGAPIEADPSGSTTGTTSVNVEAVVDAPPPPPPPPLPAPGQQQSSEGSSNSGPMDLSESSASKEESPKAEELSEQQLKLVRENTVRSSARLLLDCVSLLTSLVRALRHELGFPACSRAGGKTPTGICPNSMTQLTLLCPERLAGTAGTVGFPDRWLITLPARRRLASTLRLAMAPYKEAFALLSTLTPDPTTTTCEEPHTTLNPTLSRSLFAHLFTQFRMALDYLTTDSENDNTETSPSESTRLVSSLRIRQLCFLAKWLDTLTKQIAHRFSGHISTNRSAFVESEAEIRSALQSASWLALDPVSSAIGLNPVAGTSSSPSVATCLASMLIIMDIGKTTPDASIASSQLYDRSVDIVLRQLEDHLMSSVLVLANQSMRFGPMETNFSRVLSSVCREAFGYLELATGHAHVVKRCLSTVSAPSPSATDSAVSDSNPYPLLDLFVCTVRDQQQLLQQQQQQQKLIPVSDADHTDSSPSYTYQSCALRLLCVILLRAINAPSKRRSLFAELSKRVLERSVSGGNRSLMSFWLSSVAGLKIAPNLFTSSDRPWLVDFIGTQADHLNEPDLQESEEWNLSASINNAIRFGSGPSEVLTSSYLTQWNASRRHFRLALYFERLSRLLVSPWHEDANVIHQPTLCTALRAMYEYVTLVTYALNPSFQLDDGHLLPGDHAPGLGRPRLDFSQSVLRGQPNPSLFWTDSSVISAVRNYARFCSAVLTGHQTDRGRGRRKTASSEVNRLSACYAAVGSTHLGSSAENVADPEEEFSGPELISDYGVDDCSVEEFYMTLPGPQLNQEVCSYTATQQAFIDQHWYHCHSCRLEYSEGVCSVCARVCHAGHDLSYAKHSTFFCDCGASKDPVQRCRALSCRLKNRGARLLRRFSRQDRVTRFVEDEMLAFYAPWLADGFCDSSRSPLMLSAVQSTYGDSEDNRMSDLSDGESHGVNTRSASKSKTAKLRVKETRSSPLPPTGQKVPNAPAKVTSSVSVLVTDAPQTGSSSTPGPESIRRLLSNVRRSSGTLLIPESAVTSTAVATGASSVLRRAGAVRYKLASADAPGAKSRSKSNSGSQQTGEDSSHQSLKPSGRTNQASDHSRHSSHSQHEPVGLDVTTYSRQCRVRCACIRQFWHLIDRSMAIRLPGVVEPVDDGLRDRACRLSSAGYLSLCLVPDEQVLVGRIREQMSAPGGEKYRSNLTMVLTTSDMITKAAAFLLESDDRGKFYSPTLELPCDSCDPHLGDEVSP